MNAPKVTITYRMGWDNHDHIHAVRHDAIPDDHGIVRSICGVLVHAGLVPQPFRLNGPGHTTCRNCVKAAS